MLKRILKLLFKTILILLGFLGLYVLAAFTLPLITVNTDFSNAEQGVKIFVISNGVHTDIAVPTTHACKDWTVAFPKDSFEVKDTVHSYIGFGWGDKGFYLNTPTWDDLTFSTAFKAAFGLSETAMHVRYIKERNKNTEHCSIFVIDTLSYRKLIRYIESSFEQNKGSFPKIHHPGYGELDRFYEAIGSYSLFKTCNSWTNSGLKETGIKTACWSPLAGGILRATKP